MKLPDRKKTSTGIAATLVLAGATLTFPVYAEGLILGNDQNAQDSTSIKLDGDHIADNANLAYDDAAIYDRLNEHRDKNHFSANQSDESVLGVGQSSDRFRTNYRLSNPGRYWE